jgi:DNA-binding PadR family transcriptional regulator
LLSRERLSGYDLTRRMKGRVGYFWSARHSQIYPELARLQEGGYVTHSVVEQQERPDKKVYEITAEGLRTLKEWVVQPPVSKPSRDELVLKAYSIWLADPEEAARLFRAEGLRHEEQLAHYEELRVRMQGEWGEEIHRPDSPRFATHAALTRGIIYERGSAEWCRWVADSIEGEGPEKGRGEKKARPGPRSSDKLRVGEREPEEDGATRVP